MVKLTRALVGLSLFLISGCAGAPRPNETAGVRFVVVPETARVYTDDQFVGGARVLAVRPAAFRPGSRRFTVMADGYFPHDLELQLEPGTITVEIRLRPIPP